MENGTNGPGLLNLNEITYSPFVRLRSSDSIRFRTYKLVDNDNTNPIAEVSVCTYLKEDSNSEKVFDFNFSICSPKDFRKKTYRKMLGRYIAMKRMFKNPFKASIKNGQTLNQIIKEKIKEEVTKISWGKNLKVV